MFNLASNRALLPVAMIASMFVTTACLDDAVDPAAIVAEIAANAEQTVVITPPMSTYGAPGSNWQYDFHDDGTYSITRSDRPGMDSDLSVDGSYQLTAAGFVSMTVDASSGIDAPSVGSQLWAVEVTDFALMVAPVATSDDQLIPMVSGGQCPETDFSNNWVAVRAQASGDATSAEGSYFGSLTYQQSGGFTSLSSQYALTTGNPDQGSMDLGYGYCSDGIVETVTSDVYLGPEGSATVRANVDDASEQTMFSLPKSTIGSITDLDGSYAGVMSDDGADLNNKVSAVIVTCNSGICAGDVVTDVVTGTMAGEPFAVDLSGSINVPGTGLTTGQLQANGGDWNLGCMVDADLGGNGNRMISCAGQSPTREYRLFNLILVSND
jgi:hypothetical protein